VDAYVLLHVLPPHSQTLAERLPSDPKYGKAVDYAVAVWGRWDVVARVSIDRGGHEDDLQGLYDLLDMLHQETGVTSTETLLVRSDQRRPGTTTPDEEAGWAFVLLSVGPHEVGSILEASRTVIGVVEVAGVLGAADVLVTARYSQEPAIRKLVMGQLQMIRGVRNSETLLSIPSGG
jgi:DNA-binding Lrp family transcriptional regulator